MALKKNKLFTRFSVAMLLFLALLMGYLLYTKLRNFNFWPQQDEESNFTSYPGFGISLPNNYAIHGIDVSRYQQRINWSLVKKMADGGVAIGFAFVKATEGSQLTDAQFARNWQKTKAVGMPRGAYLFFRAGKGGPTQASYFIKQVNLLPGDLPPVVDIETLNNETPETMRQELTECLQTLQRHYGVAPILYSNATFYNTHLQGQFEQYPLWVAHYFEQRRPRVSRPWQFWQHSENGRVNGISGNVDFNVFSGDSAAFKALLLPPKAAVR
ncbi:MAG: glycoside hydrolase family 25 protein [Bacteroidetes bacterium]|nr:MAG: glycoside hydrolase family 25 protein [Bacteroidota bacterium]